ncbi:MAG: MATE family efflux transporter [Lachnospiraceae bacterium]|nr:MATE family efflux transporter [Lachnospiraceae bacterium]
MESTVKKKVGTDLTVGPIFKVLMIFAVPIILTNLIQQLYSLVDLMIVGKFVGSEGTVGVSTGGEISDFMTPLATAFAMSGQVYISQLMGVKEYEKAKRTIGTLFSVMLIASCCFAVLTLIFCNQILSLLNCPQEAWSQARAYMIITVIGMPFIFGYNGVCGVLRGMGESKKPMLFIIVAAVVNVVFDLIFVIVFRMEAAGTAIATVMSQFGSFLAAFIFMYRHKEEMGFELKLSYFRIDKEAAEKIIILAVPQMVRSTLVRFSMLWVNANVNAYGLTAAATNSVGNKIQKFMEVFMQGVESAAASMVGQNLGAKKPERAKKSILYTWGFCMVVAAISSIMFVFIPKPLYRLFTSDNEVIEFGVIYLRIMVMTIFVNGTTGAFQSMVTGCGFVSLGFLLGIVDGVISRIGFSLLFLHVFHAGVESFFWGTAFSRTLTGLVVVGYFLSGKWRTRKLLTDTDNKKKLKVKRA